MKEQTTTPQHGEDLDQMRTSKLSKRNKAQKDASYRSYAKGRSPNQTTRRSVTGELQSKTLVPLYW